MTHTNKESTSLIVFPHTHPWTIVPISMMRDSLYFKERSRHPTLSDVLTQHVLRCKLLDSVTLERLIIQQHSSIMFSCQFKFELAFKQILCLTFTTGQSCDGLTSVFGYISVFLFGVRTKHLAQR